MSRCVIKAACQLTVSASLAGGLGVHAEREDSLPNVLIFLMDDMGYGDCRVYNPDSKVSMPNLEQLAADGMTFTDAHSPSAVCAPTRYSILTGNYPWRGRNENGTWMFNLPSQILPGQKTLGHLMKDAGYSTAFFGKVHLGGTVYSRTTGLPLGGWKIDFKDIDFSRPVEGGPVDQGFDYSYELPNGIQGPPYAFFENGRITCDPEKLVMWKVGNYSDFEIKAPGFGDPGWNTSQAGPQLTGKTLQFLEQHFEKNRASGKRQPFFMHYCSQSCHTPHNPPDRLMGVPVKGASGAGAHLDMLYEADVTLGLLLKTLEQAGELDNTLVVFTSDNGGLIWGESAREGHKSGGPLRGGKAEIWEGGHRVPLIIRWGDGSPENSPVRPASRTDALVGLQDLFATLAVLTDTAVDADQGLDSCSFLPVLLGRAENIRDTLFVQANAEAKPGQKLEKMVRAGSWKLVTTRNRQPLELYNLATDLSESVNLVNHPEQRSRVREMLEELKRISGSKRSTPEIKQQMKDRR
ncbi:MAG: arylsulfatase [Kiritimatiellales bacterium]